MVKANIDISSHEVEGNTYYDYVISYTPYATMVGVASSLKKALDRIKEAILGEEESTKETLKSLGYSVF